MNVHNLDLRSNRNAIGKPLVKKVSFSFNKKLDAIKAKYALGSIDMLQPKDDSVKIHVHHKDKDNSANLIEAKILSKAELDKQFAEAVADLELKLKVLGHKETGAISESAAKAAAEETDHHFEVIDGVHVKVDGDHIVITGDVGVEHRKMATKPLFKDLDGEAKVKKPGEVEVKSEADITDADRKKHQEIAAQIKAELTKVTNPEGLDTFESLYDNKKAQANALIAKYRPKLKTGLEISITFGEINKDKLDNDIDFEIRIFPNDTVVLGDVDFEQEDLHLPDSLLIGDSIRYASGEHSGSTYRIEKVTAASQRSKLVHLKNEKGEPLEIPLPSFYNDFKRHLIIEVKSEDKEEIWKSAELILGEVEAITVKIDFTNDSGNLGSDIAERYNSALQEFVDLKGVIALKTHQNPSVVLTKIKEFKKKALVMKSSLELRKNLSESHPGASLENSNMAFGNYDLNVAKSDNTK